MSPRLVALMAGTALMTGCASSSDGTPPPPRGVEVARPLEGGVFTVTQIDGKPATGATMEFRGDRMSGKGGCNRYNAPVEVKGDGVFRLTGGVAMTMMACMPDAMETEQAFSAALEGIDRWVLRGDTLELSAKGKVRIRATRGP